MHRVTPPSAVRAAAAQSCDGATVVAVIGVHGSRPAALVDAALGTDLNSAETGGAVVVAAPSGPPADAVVLVCPALGDDTTGPQAAVGADAVSLLVSLAGVVVLNARIMDFERPSAAGIQAFAAAVGDSLDLRACGAAAPVPQLRQLIVAVREFEPDEVDSALVESIVTERLNAAYGELEHRLASNAAREFSDIFDVQFLFLPSERHFPEDFVQEAQYLARLVQDAPRNGYTDAGMTPAGLEAATVRIWDAIHEMRDPGAKRELPGDRELAATFACDAVMKTAFERYASTVRNWRTTVDSGRIIRDFGKESGNLITATLDKFAADASSYRTTKAFARKKDELRLLCLSDAYTLYAKQILKLREVAYQVFRGNLARIRINDRVEKNVNIAVKDAENYFVEKAESLRCPLSSWRFDNERHELVNHMREDATERLQLARLQGNYVPPIRAPVAVAFHTLLTAPFGRDSRVPQPGPEEMMGAKRDKDKVKKAGLSRSRPHVRRGYEFYPDKLDVVKCEEMFHSFHSLAEGEAS